MHFESVSRVLLLLFVCHVTHVSSHCGGAKGLSYVKFPDRQTLLSLESFHKHVVNKTMHEMYFATPRPAPFLPDVSYKSTITTIPGTHSYDLTITGVSLDGDPVCRNTMLHPGDIADRTQFYYPDNSTVQVYWSHCPTSYILSMNCGKYDRVKKRCPPDSVYIGIYILDNIDDLPISDIAQELCKTTGVRLGSQDRKWFFTYGNLVLC